MKKPKNVNERIDEIMLERSMTPQELAARIGRHLTTIDRILAGLNTPSYATVKAIADALNCPVDYLMKGTGPSTLEKTDVGFDPAKDTLYKELKAEAERWYNAYVEQKDMLKMTISNLGKLKPLNHTGFKKRLRAAA